MKSNETPASARSHARTLGARVAPWLAILVAAVAVGSVRSGLAQKVHSVRAHHDIYALPGPQQAVVLSLGYRSALADLLYGNVLVQYGLHFQEKRLFEFVGNYLDVINALDPKFRAPYRYADTLLTLQPKAPPLSHYEKAREVLERGMKELPYDAELFSTAGQFLAYLAPARLPDQKTKNEWRVRGARALARACEIGGDSATLPYHCITAAGLLTHTGDREAMVGFLKRVLAVTEDPNIQKLALDYLANAVGEQERERANQRMADFERARRKDLPFMSRDAIMLLGPAFAAAQCAGARHAQEAECATSWKAWAESSEVR